MSLLFIHCHSKLLTPNVPCSFGFKSFHCHSKILTSRSLALLTLNHIIVHFLNLLLLSFETKKLTIIVQCWFYVDWVDMTLKHLEKKLNPLLSPVFVDCVQLHVGLFKLLISCWEAELLPFTDMYPLSTLNWYMYTPKSALLKKWMYYENLQFCKNIQMKQG